MRILQDYNKPQQNEQKDMQSPYFTDESLNKRKNDISLDILTLKGIQCSSMYLSSGMNIFHVMSYNQIVNNWSQIIQSNNKGQHMAQNNHFDQRDREADDNDLFSIHNILADLYRPHRKDSLQIEQQHSNKLIDQQSISENEPFSNSIQYKSIKKTHIIKKDKRDQEKHIIFRSEQNQSLNFSNVSASEMQRQENSLKIDNSVSFLRQEQRMQEEVKDGQKNEQTEVKTKEQQKPILHPQVSGSKFQRSVRSQLLDQKMSQMQQKQKSIQLIRLKIQEQRQKMRRQEEGYNNQRQKQSGILKNFLKQSYQKQFQYNQYIHHFNSNLKVLERNRVLKYEENIKMLKNEESKYKVKKSKKSSLALSDEQENKAESIDRQKKFYIQTLVNKLQKEKEKCSMLEERVRNYRRVQTSKVDKINKIESMKNIMPFYYVVQEHQYIEEMLAFDLEKCHKVSIDIIKFNPTIPKEKRFIIFQKLKELLNNYKKVCSPTNMIFPHKLSTFIPISHLEFSQDEILVTNIKQGCVRVREWLFGLQMSAGQQHLNIVRYLIKCCVKGMQQLHTNSKGLSNENIIIMPSNLYLNSKFELQIQNVIFNALLFKEFKYLYKEQDYYYFPPQQKTQNFISLWSIGMLTYDLVYNARPFPKYQPYLYHSREEFLIVNQIPFPSKGAPYEKCKDFIRFCFQKKAQNFSQIFNDVFFHLNK